MPRKWWQKLVGRNFCEAKGRRSTAARRRREHLTLEPLENRLVLSNIVWTNRGDDGFEIYGSNAGRARSIVNRAIHMWEQVIQQFDTGDDYDFELEISAADLGANTLGSTQVTSEDDGKPECAEIILDDNAAGGGWFFDPTPGDNSEFTNLLNPFAATGAVAGTDYLSVILHELGHAVGISSRDDLEIRDHLSSTGTPNTFAFSAAGVTATLFLDGGGLHTSASAHPNDLMNPSIGTGTRRLISDLDARILRGAYAYFTKPPSDLPNFSFLADLNLTTGVLSVRGDPADQFGDTIKLSFPASGTVVVEGEIGPVQFSGVSTIFVVADPNAGNDGDDEISIFLPPLTTAVPNIFVSAGAGDDFLQVIGNTGADELKLSAGSVVRTNGSGVVTYSGIEDLRVGGNAGADTIRLEGLGLTVKTVDLFGSTGDDFFQVTRVPAGVAARVFGEGDNDTIRVGGFGETVSEIDGSLSISGGDGNDTVTLYDTFSTTNNSYVLTSSGISRSSAGTIKFQTGFGITIETLTVLGGLGKDTFSVESAPSGLDVRFNGGGGSDTLVGSSVPVSFLPHLWSLTGDDAGTHDGLAFGHVENLEGGTSHDLFILSSGKSLSGTLDGGGGVGQDYLDYRAYTTNVYVNLATGKATNLGGVSHIDNVFGGAGDDILVGNFLANRLYGEGGRDILIGGLGADVLDGGEGQDILISGRTANDTSVPALTFLRSEWSRTDLTYAQRIDHLRNGGGWNGIYRLNASTVSADPFADQLTGGTGLDWFWASLAEVTDKAAAELVD